MKKQETLINFSITGLVKIVFVGLIAFLLFSLKDLILILLTAIVIASFVESSKNYLFKEFNMPRGVAIGLIYIFFFLILSGIFYFFVPIFIRESLSLISTLAEYFPDLALGSSDIFKNITNTSQLSQLTTSAQILSANLSGGFFTTLANIFGGIVNFILIMVISFYLSIEERGIEKFLKIITPIRHEKYVISLWTRTERKITLWIRGQMILGLIVGLITYIALAIAGVKYALIFAILTAIMELIPYGVLLAAVPAIAVGFSDGGLTKGLIVTGIFVVIQQLENYLLQPLVLKRSVGISPLVVIISVLAGAKLAGFWGLILAIPVAVAILEYLSDVEQNKIHIHLKDTPSGTKKN